MEKLRIIDFILKSLKLFDILVLVFVCVRFDIELTASCTKICTETLNICSPPLDCLSFSELIIYSRCHVRAGRSHVLKMFCRGHSK